MEERTKQIQNETFLCTMFANDAVLIVTIIEVLKYELEQWNAEE